MSIEKDLNATDLKVKPLRGLSAAAQRSGSTSGMKDFSARIASVDDNVGRLLDYLEWP